MKKEVTFVCDVTGPHAFIYLVDAESQERLSLVCAITNKNMVRFPLTLPEDAFDTYDLSSDILDAEGALRENPVYKGRLWRQRTKPA